MLAGGRLEALLEQAVDAQLARCMFHNNHRVAVSLLSDYEAGAEQIPTTTVQVPHPQPPLSHRAPSRRAPPPKCPFQPSSGRSPLKYAHCVIQSFRCWWQRRLASLS